MEAVIQDMEYSILPSKTGVWFNIILLELINNGYGE